MTEKAVYNCVKIIDSKMGAWYDEAGKSKKKFINGKEWSYEN